MLDQRLQTVASLVRNGSRLADIGTDHALLPCSLVLQGHCPSAIASDIRVGPADAARRSVAACGLAEQVEVRLGDGLSTVLAEEVDDIVIAGMGGETIAQILEQAPWVKHPHYRLILQPMTRAERLRRYLFEQGFSIETECPVSDGTHCYTVIAAIYTATPFVPEEAVCYVGKLPLPEGEAFLSRVSARLQKQQDAQPQSSVATCLQYIDAYRRGVWDPWRENQ